MQSHSVVERRQAWLEGRELPRMDLYAPEFRPPRTPAEFFDDLIIQWGRMPAFPECPLLLAVAVPAQAGDTAAAVKAVKAAKGLERPVQASVYRNFEAWRTHADAVDTGASSTVLAVEAEWERLKLATTTEDDE